MAFDGLVAVPVVLPAGVVRCRGCWGWMGEGEKAEAVTIPFSEFGVRTTAYMHEACSHRPGSWYEALWPDPRAFAIHGRDPR